MECDFGRLFTALGSMRRYVLTVMLMLPLCAAAQITTMLPPGEATSVLPDRATCPASAATCPGPARPASAPGLLDSTTAADQAARAQAQADQAQAEQALQRRIQLEQSHPGTIFVFGDRPSARAPSIHDVFTQALGVAPQSLTSSSFDAMGRRTECANMCYGPMCCVTVPSAADPVR